ncbi:hypothetical protein GRO01_11090 [Gluconobacter roseus NBRC 3990]|uniref:Uncharacterized protein n=1 Tax=Gluconobacter roseus NBRC 3990 TaxID=1307950 RepID=A0A4Y3M4I7_9PROT|nr:hypothetical protein AA3990_1887 [Gluconobacter roseus NBRC 3990]GEB03533.1 hypothetical protein GRO01_11090 [Gluconobacter roseus NBRC 3990]GLP93988.1 hypothetical protein GCM10007871_19660 [Gluconobacter roseus NBRC 3990]
MQWNRAKADLTSDWHKLAELDHKLGSASYLSIALVLLCSPATEGDLYALPGLEETHRDAIKR